MAEFPTYSYMPGSYMGRAFPAVPSLDLSVAETPMGTIDTRGEFSKGFSRGVSGLQQMGYGAAGLASDIIGADRAKEYFYGQAEQKQAEQALSPAAVPQFTDISSAGELGQWFMGAVGEALPSSAASLMGSGVGAAIFRAATLKLASNAALKGALAGQVERMVATGVAKKEAEKTVLKEFFKSELAQQAAATGVARGSYAGAMASGSGMEAGSNWLEDVQKYGFEGTNPLKDLAFGIAGGAVEAGLGAERRLVGQFARQKAEKEMLNLAARKGFLGGAQTIGTEIAKSSAGEAGEEFTQQLLNQAAVMRDASLDDMLYAKQDFKAAFNAGMAGAAGGVLFGATGGARAHLGSRGYTGGQTDQNTPEAILERKNNTLEVATQKAQATVQQYDAGLAQLDAGRQKLMDNLRQISITVQNPAQQEQLMSQVQQQLIVANAQRVNLQKEKDNFLEETKKELTKINKKEDLKILEAQAEEAVKAPKSLVELKERSLEEERKAIGLAAIDTHAQREINKADARITEHQKAIEQLNNSMAATRRAGGIIGNENVDLLKWHEQQIADERKYAATVLKEYNKAKDTKNLTPTTSLFDLYRDKDHARNLTAYEYQNKTKGIADALLTDAVKAGKMSAETSLAERLNSKRNQNILRDSAASSVDGMTRAISAATRMNEINNVLKPAAERRDVARMANQVANSVRVPEPGFAQMGTMPLSSTGMQAEMNRLSASRTPVELAARPLGAQVQPAGYQRLALNQRLEAVRRQQEVAAAERAGALRMHNEMIAEEKANKVAYQKLSMDKNQARNEGKKRLVAGWIAPTIDQLKSLKDVVKVIHSDETYLLPDYVQEAYSGKGSALIDLNTGTIYMFADKMHNKQHAVRTLLHESVAHFGLRAIMTPDQLDKFLHMVAREFVGTDRWQDIADRYPDYDTFSIAEEYVARYAEELRLNEKTMTRAKLMFEKVKAFFRNLLEQLGLVKVTDQDIKDVLLASAYNLTQGKNLREQVKGHGDSDYRGVLNVNYAGFYSPLQKFIEKINVNPNKPMPAKFWLDQIFPKGKLRQGLSEEEMQYYKDQMGGMSLKEFLSEPREVTTPDGKFDGTRLFYNKQDLIKALAAYFDQVGIEEVVQDSRKMSQKELKRLQSAVREEEKNILHLARTLVSEEAVDFISTELDAAGNNAGQLFSYLVRLAKQGDKYLPLSPGDMKYLTGKFGNVYRINNIPLEYKSLVSKFMVAGSRYLTAHDAVMESQQSQSIPHSSKNLVTDGSTNHRNFLVTAPALEDFTEGHTFGDKDTNDTIFWIRTSDIKDSDGNKVLHIEEVQSDRIQAGVEVDKKTGKPKRGFAPNMPLLDEEGFPYFEGNPVPYTPLVQGYNLLAIKRMIAFAAENGYDKVSWTSGEAQIDRWTNDLRANVNSMSWKTGVMSMEERASIKEKIDRYEDSLKGTLEDFFGYADTVTRKILSKHDSQDSLDVLDGIRRLKNVSKNGISYTQLEAASVIANQLSTDLEKLVEAPWYNQVSDADHKSLTRMTASIDNTAFNLNQLDVLTSAMDASYQNKLVLDVTYKGGKTTSFEFKDGSTLTAQGWKTLEELVGKDMARKITAEPSGKLEGEGLSIGGHGFKSVYDGEMVNQANRYLKNLDPSVRVTDLPFAGYKMHSFPVTELMKQKIEGGQPVYGRTLFESRDGVAADGAWRNVRESREFKQQISEPISRAKKFLTSTNTTISDGKIIPSENVTVREQINMLAADAQYPMLNVQRFQEMILGKALPTEQNWYMAEKASANKQARETAHFNREVIGWDPNDPSYKAKEGQLVYEISKLATPGMSVKELWDLVGKVLAYYHAPEANRELAARSVSSKRLANVDKKIATLKAERSKGNLTPARAVALEEELAKANEVRAEILDVRQDLFMGVSTEDALKFIDEVVNKSPNKLQWMKVIGMVQDINTRILDKAVANQLITPEFRKLLDDTYEFYVPNRMWTDTLERRSPGFGAKSKIFNETNYSFTKERKGSDKQGMNPITALILKHSDVVVAAQSKKDYAALADNIQANPEMLSEIFIEDDKRAVKAASDKLKASLKKAEELMPKENLRTISDVIRGLYKRINELSVEQVRHQRNILKYTTDKARANADAALTQVEADIANARETIALLKEKRESLLKSKEYTDVMATIKANREELRASRKDRGWTRSYNDLGELVWTRNPSKFTGQMDKVITLTNSNGETTRYMVTNDIILAALKGTSTVEAGPIIRFLGSLQRKMAMLMTTLNPVFTAVNGFRDWVTANIHIRHLADDIAAMGLTRDELTRRYNAMVFGTNGNQKNSALRLMYNYAREGTTGDPVWDAKIKEFEKSGAYTTMFNLGSHTQIEKSLVRAIDRAGDNENAAQKALYATMNWLTDASGAVENASRFSAYVVIYDALVAKGVSASEAQKVAGDAALDLTVNFTKRGQWGPIISGLFLFGQANINSTIRIMRAMFPASDRNKPIAQRRITRYLTGLMGLGLLLSMIARATGGDDDDGLSKYDKLSDNKRDTNIIFGIGGRFLTLPVTFGYQLFYTMGSVLSDMLVGRTTKSEVFKRIVDSSLQNFFLVGGGGSGIIELTPSVFKPLVQIAANTNYFGSNVYPEAKSWEKGIKPDSQKYWKNTPTLFRYFTETVNSMFGGSKDRSSGMTDISPASIDHAFRSYLGGVGDLILKTSALTANIVAGRSEAVRLGDVPLISRFVTSPTIESTLHEYSKYKREVETQVAEYKRARAEKVDAATMQKIAADTAKARLLNMKLEAIQKQMAEISAAENKLANNPNVSSETKFNKKQADDKKSEALAKSFIRSAVAAGVR